MVELLDGDPSTCFTVQASSAYQHCGSCPAPVLPHMFGLKLWRTVSTLIRPSVVKVKLTGQTASDCQWESMKIFSNIKFNPTCTGSDSFSMCAFQIQSFQQVDASTIQCTFSCSPFSTLHFMFDIRKQSSVEICEISYS